MKVGCGVCCGLGGVEFKPRDLGNDRGYRVVGCAGKCSGRLVVW